MRSLLLIALLGVAACATLDVGQIACATDVDCVEGYVCVGFGGDSENLGQCTEEGTVADDDDDDDDTEEPRGPYTCGWPTNDDSLSWSDPGFDSGPTLGQRVPAYVGQDACGEDVHLWDFGRDGRPVLLVFSAWWAIPSTNLSEALDGGDDPFEYLPEAVEEALAQERVWVMHLLSEDDTAQPADQGDLFRYQQEFADNPGIAVLTDSDRVMYDWAGGDGYPEAILLNQSMEILSGPGDGFADAIATLAQLF